MLRYGHPPYLEASSKGDKRFSAFYARVRGKTIEEHYQAAKVFEDGSTGLAPKATKGRRAVNQEDCHALYAELWREYVADNPELVDVLVEASGISDIFGQQGHACQAEELWKIRSIEIAKRAGTEFLSVDEDIFSSNAQALVNPVNCVGVMGKGLAAEFKARFPEMFKSYKAMCDAKKLRPGVLHTTVFDDGGRTRHLINLPTKRHWRDASKLADIDKGLAALATFCEQRDIRSIAVPKLGCGLGGLDWNADGGVRERVFQHLLDVPSLQVELHEGAPEPTSKKPFRVIVAGSRDFDDYPAAKLCLQHILGRKIKAGPVEILCGGARGADALGRRFQREMQLLIGDYPAIWKPDGPNGRTDYEAGFKRNQEMADDGDALIAFWDGESRGTADMIVRAADAGLEIRVFQIDAECMPGQRLPMIPTIAAIEAARFIKQSRVRHQTRRRQMELGM